MITRYYENKNELSTAAAEFFAEEAANAIARKGYFTVALSGGSTPIDVFDEMLNEPFRDTIQWEKIFFFWGDERYVPVDDQRNNSHMAFKHLLNHVNAASDHIFPIPTSFSPEKCADIYEELLRTFMKDHPGPLDLIWLGLGSNAHTASLFPGRPVLHETKRWVVSDFVEEAGMHRITFTAHFINQAANVVFIVSGSDKAEAFKNVTGENYDPDKYPAQLIKPQNGKLYWLVDKSVIS